MKSLERLLKEHDSLIGETGITHGMKRIKTNRSGQGEKFISMPGHVTDFMSQKNRTVKVLDEDRINAYNSNWERF